MDLLWLCCTISVNTCYSPRNLWWTPFFHRTSRWLIKILQFSHPPASLYSHRYLNFKTAVPLPLSSFTLNVNNNDHFAVYLHVNNVVVWHIEKCKNIVYKHHMTLVIWQQNSAVLYSIWCAIFTIKKVTWNNNDIYNRHLKVHTAIATSPICRYRMTVFMFLIMQIHTVKSSDCGLFLTSRL